MPVTTCPGCQATHTVPDAARGKRIRCKHCGQGFEALDNVETCVQAGAPLRPVVPAAADRRPVGPREPVQSGSGLAGWLILGGVALFGLFALCGGVGVYAVYRVKTSADQTFAAVSAEMAQAEAEMQVQQKKTPRRGTTPPPEPPVIERPPVPPVVEDGPMPVAPMPVVPNPVRVPPPPPPPADPLAKALFELQSKDVFTVRRGCDALAKMAPEDGKRKEVVAALKAVVADPGTFAPRTEALLALGAWAGPEEVPYFVGLLDHKDFRLRGAAWTALALTKDEAGAEAIAKRLEDQRQRHQAAEALKQMGAVAEKAVRERLKSKDLNLQITACQILQKIATEASYPDLKEVAWSDNDDLARVASEALPEKERPPVWGPEVTMKLNVHLKDMKLWPDLEKRLRALTDHPRGKVKMHRSGDYLWIDLKPVMADAPTFAKKVTFLKPGAIHKDGRLIYFDSGK